MHFLIDCLATIDQANDSEGELVTNIKTGGPASTVYEQHEVLLGKSVRYG